MTLLLIQTKLVDVVTLGFLEIGLMQGCPTLILEGCCPAGFRCFPASNYRLNGSLRKIFKFCTSLLMMHCSESDLGKHLKPVGQQPSRTGRGHPWYRGSKNSFPILTLCWHAKPKK